MSIRHELEQSLLASIDTWYAFHPQPTPPREKIKECRIVSHRGEHDNRTVFENTRSAFDLAVEHGVWGIELDIRWTEDRHPVVFHDPDFLRFYDSSLQVHEISLSRLQKRFPLIPSLAEVVERYGGRAHLMVEIKQEIYPEPAYQNEVLKNLLAGLSPVRDYHLISLHPEMFRFVPFAPVQALLPVAEMNVPSLSALALDRGYGGLTGHYFLLNSALLKKHRNAGQKLGTGFITSERCLFREINRGVEWIFSNDAVKLQKICDKF